MLRKGMMALVRRDVGSKPCRDGAERRVDKVPLQQVPHPGQKREVTQLAIALPEARENANDLCIPLRATNGVDGIKIAIRSRNRLVVRDHLSLNVRRHIPPRVLQQRDEIIGMMADQRLLKIQKPKPMRTDRKSTR